MQEVYIIISEDKLEEVHDAELKEVKTLLSNKGKHKEDT